MKGKDVKKSEVGSKDPEIQGFNYDEFFNNRLSLPKSLKDELTSKGLDWRFINATQFRSKGNMHQSHWVPYKPEATGIVGTNAEGLIQRGDLILAVREKAVSKAHKEFLTKRNKLQSSANKEHARELRKMVQEAGAAGQAKVFEGYEENE